MTRQEHLAWCKRRALEYLDAGDYPQALASMVSDLNKHEETAVPGGSILVLMGMQAAQNQDYGYMRRWIEGF